MSAPGPDAGATATAAPEAPWHAAYPTPKISEPASLTREEVLDMLKKRSQGPANSDFVLVDVRRNDHQVSRDSQYPVPAWSQNLRRVGHDPPKLRRRFTMSRLRIDTISAGRHGPRIYQSTGPVTLPIYPDSLYSIQGSGC